MIGSFFYWMWNLIKRKIYGKGGEMWRLKCILLDFLNINEDVIIFLIGECVCIYLG